MPPEPTKPGRAGRVRGPRHAAAGEGRAVADRWNRPVERVSGEGPELPGRLRGGRALEGQVGVGVEAPEADDRVPAVDDVDLTVVGAGGAADVLPGTPAARSASPLSS
nr:hypothetical protein GCM10020093_027810 [Planobispora longispora]